MGFGNYFKAPAKKGAAPVEAPAQTISEKPPSVNHGLSGFETPSAPRTPYAGSSRNSFTDTRSERSSYLVDEIKHEVMCNYLYQQQCGNLWVSDNSGELEGVLLRKRRNEYLSCPPALASSPFAYACAALNVQCAMTVNSRVVKTFLSWSPDAVDVPLLNGLRIQILPSLEDLPRARKHQFAAFIASDALLVVWHDEALELVARAKDIENELMQLVWQAGQTTVEDEKDKKKHEPTVTEIEIDPESGQYAPDQRPTHLQNTVLVGLTLALVVAGLGGGYRNIASSVPVDKNYMRAAFVLLTPVQIFFTLFFAQVIVGCIAQCVGPIKQLHMNSKYYSARLPPRIQSNVLPHVTIQCPVYKEGLQAVIMPTVKSIKQAISTYELQGGSANMFINDDGLQSLSEDKRNERIEFYADHSIGWTARPPDKLDGFVRKGKFKKASNMNFGLMISNRVEEKLAMIDRPADWTQVDEAQAYERALQDVVDEHGRAWADGNIRMGDYILLIDSDTQVPADCLLDAVSEMELSPEVGILQFSSAVMQVAHNYFENGITFFTNLIYTAIRYTVANGDVAPFVGHNAILRWSAVQQVAYQDEDGYDKYWSESHVSEDFDMSLRLQCDNYSIRLAAWAGDGFKEGVSLTVYDELARWEKYAYGCNELLFYPLIKWPYKGPFTPLFRRFLFSKIRFTSKVTIVSYIGTYYAIGAAWLLTTVNYFAIGWFNGYLDKYYIDSWKVWFSIVIVFNLLGNIALAILRYRSGEKAFLSSLIENFKWIIMFSIFLGGLSLHVSQAIVAHFVGYNMTWGATEKELKDTNFFIEVPKVFKKFKFSLLFGVVGIVGMIILGTPMPFIPPDWRILDFVAIVPMATIVSSHLLLPIALNPGLMTFAF